ncbi:hypothetical protein [Streptomyces sp. NPDC048172]|uniref:hypothetical protein n=1 Tax=Streptomyces sp. NPDC048172 TaxID=3365505 RepID=UPI00371A4ED2
MHDNEPRRRGVHPGVLSAALLAGALVVSVLLFVIRDIAVAAASTGVAGFVLHALFSCGKSEQR